MGVPERSDPDPGVEISVETMVGELKSDPTRFLGVDLLAEEGA